eukprot:Gb_24781 [translate_table: standard]
MGRPEPCVLFAQSFIHPHLDEYVDEVRFTEPVVISACEFLEQNASASCSMITLSGASFPPSFALEAFVQCEGETRFRRLCPPFLYSPSSSNMLEVQAVVTNHLVIRGSYRTLSLVVYGNTAEELGQFSVEFDLDNSLASLVRSPPEGKIEDLPLALQHVKPTFEESISSLQWLHLAIEPQQLLEVKQLLYLTAKIVQTSLDESSACKMVKALLSATSPFLSIDFSVPVVSGNRKHFGIMPSHNKIPQTVLTNLVEAKHELLELYKELVSNINGSQSGHLEDQFDKVELVTEELVLYIFRQWFQVDRQTISGGFSKLTQVEQMIGGLSTVHLLCIDAEGCYQFVKAGGMQHLINVLQHDLGQSTATTLMALGAGERACRYAFGCEAFLGWWPRKDEHIPTGTSEGYSTLLKLLLQKQRHDIACLATHILHRLRAYEIIVIFESMVISLLESPSGTGKVPESSIKALVGANSELKKLLKLLNLRDPIEDPSPIARANKLLIIDQDDSVLSYNATFDLIGSSKYCIAQRDIDPHLLLVLKERCFLPLLAALLSSPSLRSGTGSAMDIFIDLVTTIEAILLSLLFCRSGLLFLLSEPEATVALVIALRGVENIDREEFLSLRYAAVLISKGFFCPPQDIGMIVETNLRVVSAIDRLIGAAHHSEEMLWALWDLCSVSRSEIGRQAVLALGHFPEAISVLMVVLQSGKESEPVNSNNGTCPLSLAIFHAAAELFEVMVTDSTAFTQIAWIPHAVDLHKALHSSSPGSNKKDAPSRLLEWVDAAVVYHKKGVIGLLRYAGLLASGGDAQLTSASLLVSDPMDVDNIGADSAGGMDFRPVESLLGKLVSDKFFDGIIFRDSSIPQLTTAMRILSFVSEHPGVATGLYEEGAVTVLYVIIKNCALMLERSSNTYDYLVDEGAECNSTADLLLERSREHHLVEMLLPSLVLLITLLRKLQESGEQHRNTKLLNALLRLHREVSPKLASCTAVLPFSYPGSTLALGAVSHLLVSSLACWPIFGWTPGLFQCLLENVPAPASLALGPKEACSVLCLLGELFPEEGVWLWKNGTSSLNALRTLGIGTLLGVRSIEDIDWYLQPPHFEKLLSRLMPHLDKIAQIVLHFACAALEVLQDMLRVLIIRMACQKPDHAAVLLRPLLAWIQNHICDGVSISEMDAFKGERLLEFLAGILEHPSTKMVLMKEGLVDILTQALDKKNESSPADEKSTTENVMLAKDVFCLQWYSPIFRSLSLICDPGVSVNPTELLSRRLADCPPFEGWCNIILRLLRFCQVARVGKELQACWDAIVTLASHNLGRAAFAFIALQMQSSSFIPCQDLPKEQEKVFAVTSSDESEDRTSSPLFDCWKNLVAEVEADNGFSNDAIEIIKCFALGSVYLCAAGKSGHGVMALRSLFGLDCGSTLAEQHNEEKLRLVFRMLDLLNTKINESGTDVSLRARTNLEQTRAAVTAMLHLLEKPSGKIQLAEIAPKTELPSSVTELPVSSGELPPHLSIGSEFLMKINKKLSATSDENIGEPDKRIERTDDSYFLGGLADRFMWECPDSSPDRPTMPSLPLKRKTASVEGSNRRQRGDGVGSGAGVETTATSSFVRTGGPTVSSSGQTRRDTFRQRKPNTSRPPSMHVDDYVARERNNDGMSSSSNVATSAQRASSTGGRPPSIHVDEFMARQRERQQPPASAGGDLQQPVQTLPPETESNVDKSSKSRQMKVHLEDDLQEINIELDVVSETDDVFPPSDDCQPAPVILPEENSPDSLVDDTEFNANNSAQFVPGSKEMSEALVDGNNSASLVSREPVTQSESGILRHGSVTSDKGQGKHSTSTETPFRQEQFDNRMPNSVPITSKGYEAVATSKTPPSPLPFYDHGSVGEQRPMPLPALPQRPSQSQASPGPVVTVPQPHFEQKGPVRAPPLPRLPPPPIVASGISPQMIDASPSHASPYVHSVRDVQPPLPSGLPFQAFESSSSSAASSMAGREQRPAAPKDYYKEGIGSSMSMTTAPPLPPSSSRSVLEGPLRPPPPLHFHSEHPHPVSYSSVAPAIPPRSLLDTLSGVNTSTPWAGVSSTARISDEITASSSGSGRPPPPLPPTPPPPVLQAALQTSNVQPVSSLYIQTSAASLPPLPTSSSDKRFGSFSAPTIGPSSAPQSHPLPPPFVPPLPPGRPTTLPGNLPGGVTAQQQGQNQHSHTHHMQQHLLSQPPQPPPQPRQPPQPPQPPRPPQPPQPPQQPRPPLQLHQQQLEQRQQIHTQGSMHQPHIQFQPQPPQLQQHPHPPQTLAQHAQMQHQQSQQPYYQHQQQEQHQHEQSEHFQPQHQHQQGEHVQQQHPQQQESGLTLQQYFTSPEAIQALLSDQERLRQLLEQHPKLMQMLQERLSQL